MVGVLLPAVIVLRTDCARPRGRATTVPPTPYTCTCTCSLTLSPRTHSTRLKQTVEDRVKTDEIGKLFVSCCNPHQATRFPKFYPSLLCLRPVKVKIFKHKQFYELNINFKDLVQIQEKLKCYILNKKKKHLGNL